MEELGWFRKGFRHISTRWKLIIPWLKAELYVVILKISMYIYLGNFKNAFFGLCICLNGAKIALRANCNKCGNEILIFNSECDGYDRECEGISNSGDVNTLEFAQFKCKCCLGNSFSIKVKYEYAALDETDTDKIDNAFTWIWITLECNLCHTKYKNFISYETG